MNFLSVGLVASLAWFVTIDLVASIIVAALAPYVLRERADGSLPISPAGLVALRLMPFIAATVVVLVWVAPAYWTFEPRHVEERIGLSLAALAAAAMAMLARSVVRITVAAIHTARVGRIWTARANAVDSMQSGMYAMPVYDVHGAHAIVALVGVIRPRLFIAERVRAALSSEELSVVVAHELAHRTRFDNVARLLFRGCRDVLALLPAGRRIERAWTMAAEQSADSRAAGGDRVRAVHLASALVKVARLMPQPLPPAVVWSGLHDGGQEALLPARVRRLLASETPRPDSSVPAVALSSTVTAAAIVAAPAAWPIVHEATEWLVRMLP